MIIIETLIVINDPLIYFYRLKSAILTNEIRVYEKKYPPYIFFTAF